MNKPADGKQTLIEAGTKFTGAFNSENAIVVRGAIEGEVTGPSLTVADTGVVSGKVVVKELYSRGEIAGEYEAETVQLSGKVRDQTVIRAKVLEVKLAAEKGGMEVVFGDVDLEIGDIPAKNDIIAQAQGEGEADAAPAPEKVTNGKSEAPPASIADAVAGK